MQAYLLMSIDRYEGASLRIHGLFSTLEKALEGLRTVTKDPDILWDLPESGKYAGCIVGVKPHGTATYCLESLNLNTCKEEY